MSEVPSLWHDLGLNYYHQSCLSYVSEADQNVSCLLLEKAQEVRQNLTCQFMISLLQELNLFFFPFCLIFFSVFKKGYHAGQ